MLHIHAFLDNSVQQSIHQLPSVVAWSNLKRFILLCLPVRNVPLDFQGGVGSFVGGGFFFFFFCRLMAVNLVLFLKISKKNFPGDKASNHPWNTPLSTPMKILHVEYKPLWCHAQKAIPVCCWGGHWSRKGVWGCAVVMTPFFQASRRSLAYQFTINALLMCPHLQF